MSMPGESEESEESDRHLSKTRQIARFFFQAQRRAALQLQPEGAWRAGDIDVDTKLTTQIILKLPPLFVRR